MAEYTETFAAADATEELYGAMSEFNSRDGEGVQLEEESVFIRLYRKTFQASGTEVRQRHEELDREHTRLMAVIERFRGNPRALAKKQEELQQCPACYLRCLA